MATTQQIPSISTELQAALRETLDQLARGVRDPEAAKKACERMDRLREENRQLFGGQNIAVEIIREIRNSR
jgi:hypothetical protein